MCGIISALVFLFSNNEVGIEEDIQKNFHSLEKQAEQAATNLLKNKVAKTDAESSIFLHLYENDSLKYWNTNKMPVPRLSSLKFPSSGLTHLKNGWYYSC